VEHHAEAFRNKEEILACCTAVAALLVVEEV
jgi:hypothetical protein